MWILEDGFARFSQRVPSSRTWRLRPPFRLKDQFADGHCAITDAVQKSGKSITVKNATASCFQII